MPPPLKLLLLPISTRRALIYCDPAIHKGVALAPGAKPSISDRVINKANTTWAEWEKSNTTWKLKIVQYGNMMFKRIPFEEWGLKSIPPKPKAVKGNDATTTKDPRLDKVELRYPGKYFQLCKPGLNEMLAKISTERKALHRQRMWYSIVAMPFTAPVAILPVIPNIPFFYLVFRAWSHWKALRGSEHLEHLLKTDGIRTVPSAVLDSLYTAGLLHKDAHQSRASPVPTEEQTNALIQDLRKKLSSDADDVLLLHTWNGKLIAEKLDLPSLEVEVERAVEQVQKGIEEKTKKKAESIKSATSSDDVTKSKQ